MLLRQLKELMVKGSIYCNSKTQYQNSLFQPSENLYFELYSAGPTMMGPVVGSRYKRMFNMFLLNFVAKVNKMVLL